MFSEGGAGCSRVGTAAGPVASRTASTGVIASPLQDLKHMRWLARPLPGRIRTVPESVRTSTSLAGLRAASTFRVWLGVKGQGMLLALLLLLGHGEIVWPPHSPRLPLFGPGTAFNLDRGD